MKTISLKLQEDLEMRLSAAAKKRGETRSSILREALNAYLDSTRNAADGSCLELVADLAGCVKGPGDLSHNPKHMRGYGK